MTLTMYERIGHETRRPSPFSWRIRYALAHKGVEPQFRHVRFADVETVRALSGQHLVPIITDGDRVIHDSWNIACYLEERFPDRPSLFAGSGERAVTRLINHWADQTLGTAVRRLIAADFVLCLDADDRAYYRRSREAAFGCTLEGGCVKSPCPPISGSFSHRSRQSGNPWLSRTCPGSPLSRGEDDFGWTPELSHGLDS